MPETRTVKGFAGLPLPKCCEDFECRTFDLSDNSPCVYFNLLFSSLKFRSKNFWREKRERTLKNIRFLILKTLINGGFPADETTKLGVKFRVVNILTE